MTESAYRLLKHPLQSYEGLSLTFCSKDNCPLTWQQVLQGWQSCSDFQTFFSSVLETVPYAAYFWETPPLTLTQRYHPFTCVVINSPALAEVKADYSPFAAYLKPAPQLPDIRVFSNLGGDAQLVAPCPAGTNATYPHLAAFLRRAPSPLKSQLWATLAETILARLDLSEEDPIWVSTSGLGVFWLHVRLDREPKYYQYAPFRQKP
jgi:hypothetical protein